MHNKNDWSIFIPPVSLALALIMVGYAIGVVEGNVYPFFPSHPPATATSTEVWYCHGTPCPPEDAIEIQINNIYKQIGIPTSTDAESGQANNCPTHCEEMTADQCFQDYDYCMEQIPQVALTSTAWNCKNFIGDSLYLNGAVLDVSFKRSISIDVTMGGTSTPESEGYSECTHLTN
jgi:hypothetical protein